MEDIVDEDVSVQDLKKFELQYNECLKLGKTDEKTEFNYAWCLVRSQYNDDMKKGLVLLEGLYKNSHDDHAKRDYLYYLAIGCLRLKDYNKASKYTNAILHVEPQNHQAMQLKVLIEKRMKKDGLIGMAVLGGAAAVGIGAVAAIGALAGLALSKKS